MPDIRSWVSFEIAWTQRYLVATAARMLYSLETAEVTSKRRAMEWAIGRCGAGWEPLLRQVIADRPLGFDLGQPPRLGSVVRSFAFAEYAREIANAAQP